jgi:hypothetical protein
MDRIVLLLLFTCTAVVGQSSDSQAVHALVQELRQLRQEIRGMTVAGQRVQILLHRLQWQDEATKRAVQRHSYEGARLKEAQRAQTEASTSMKTANEQLASLRDPAERSNLERVVAELTRRIETATRNEANFREAEVAAAADLAREQAKLTDLQQRLDRLEQQLESYSK